MSNLVWHNDRKASYRGNTYTVYYNVHGEPLFFTEKDIVDARKRARKVEQSMSSLNWRNDRKASYRGNTYTVYHNPHGELLLFTENQIVKAHKRARQILLTGVPENLGVGDIVDTGAPSGSWYKYGRIIDVVRGDKVKVQHSNGEIATYGLRQLSKTDKKTLPY